MRAVDGVSFSLRQGETLGLVGESGCGKSTLCRAALQLIEPSSGSVRFEGREIAGLSRREMRPLRREMQIVFQDPYASLNPRKRIGQIVGDPLKLQGVASGAELRRQVQELLEPGRPLSRALRPLPARVLRWAAAADRDRPGAGAAPEADRRRRAGLRPRRLDPGADPRPARRAAGGLRPHLPLRRPRHRRRPPRLRPDRGDERGPDRRGGPGRPGLRAAPGPLHPQAARRGADPRPARGAGTSANCRVRLTLPLAPPIKPQLALTRKELPLGEEWAYEQKLDGFRAIVFVDGDEAYVQSRGGKALSRYFPELSFPRGPLRARRRAGDPRRRGQPRVRRAAEPHPPGRVADHPALQGDPSRLRRLRPPCRGRGVAAGGVRSAGGASGWTRWPRAPGSRSARSAPTRRRPRSGCARTEGTMAKQLDAPYVPGKRKGMAKVKREREIDCVVMGWRPGKEEGTVGSLILGLYDGEDLRSVGHISGFSARGETRPSLAARTAGDRRERNGGAKPLDRRARPRVGRAPPRAGDRSRLRPRRRGTHPPRRAVPQVPRRQGPARVPVRAAGRHLRPAVIHSPNAGSGVQSQRVVRRHCLGRTLL